MGPMDISVVRDWWSEDHGNTFSGLAGKTIHFLMLNSLEQTSMSDKTSQASSLTTSCI